MRHGAPSGNHRGALWRRETVEGRRVEPALKTPGIRNAMHLVELLPSTRVRVGLEVESKPALLDALARLLAGDDDPAPIATALATRERLGSTGLGHGVAIPHGRSDAAGEPRAAFVRLARPLDWGAADSQPVDLVIALVVPTHFTEGHLDLLAEVAAVFSDADLTATLRAAPDAAALRSELERARTR
jgi:PTS system nitrogen regulatory IIA component